MCDVLLQLRLQEFHVLDAQIDQKTDGYDALPSEVPFIYPEVKKAFPRRKTSPKSGVDQLPKNRLQQVFTLIAGFGFFTSETFYRFRQAR